MSERAALCLVIDSSTTNPTVVINGPYQCGGADSADVIAVTASGNSGYQYDPTAKTWQLNWKTTGLSGGKCYHIYISLGAGRATSAFPTPRQVATASPGIGIGGGDTAANAIAIPILAHDRPHLEKELDITVPGK